MPNYDYQCAKCGKFEIWQSIKDDALKACPSCGAKVERLISANVGLVLKGSGFYQNDYKNNSPAPAEAKPADASGPGCGACGSPDPCPSGNN
jgi:putative FmdB family regulatory protein